MVLKHDGSVWATGDNKYGQLGDGSTNLQNSYVQVIVSGAKAIAAGNDHSVVLKEDGSVWATGRNNFGQLGNGPKTFRTTFAQVISGGVQAVAAGGWHSMVLRDSGALLGTGANMLVSSEMGLQNLRKHSGKFCYHATVRYSRRVARQFLELRFHRLSICATDCSHEHSAAIHSPR